MFITALLYHQSGTRQLLAERRPTCHGFLTRRASSGRSTCWLPRCAWLGPPSSSRSWRHGRPPRRPSRETSFRSRPSTTTARTTALLASRGAQFANRALSSRPSHSRLAKQVRHLCRPALRPLRPPYLGRRELSAR